MHLRWSKRLLGWVYTQPFPVEMVKEVQYNRKKLNKIFTGPTSKSGSFFYIHSQKWSKLKGGWKYDVSKLSNIASEI